jgi:hypothetical protein
MSGFSLPIEARPGYLYARVTGAHSVENVLAYTRRIHEAGVAHERDAVLIARFFPTVESARLWLESE